MARASEISKEQLKVLRSESSHNTISLHVDELKTNPARKPEKRKTFNCWRCGTVHAYRQCPAFGSQCRNCAGYNHYEKNCTNNKRQQKSTHVSNIAQVKLDDDTKESNEVYFIGTIKQQNITCSWTEIIELGETKIKFKLDTGAQANVISTADISRLHPPVKVIKTNASLTAFGGARLKPVRCATIRMLNHNLKFYIVEENVKPILGLQACKTLELIRRIPREEQGYVPNHCCMSVHSNELIKSNNEMEEMVEKLIDEYEDVFCGLGKMPGTYHIELKPSVSPIIHAPRNVPFSMRSKLKLELERLKQLSVIEKISHPTDWVNSLIMVEKSNGKVRICLDPGDLNRAIRRPHHKAPTGREIADKLAGEKLFTVLDLAQAYHPVQLDDLRHLF